MSLARFLRDAEPCHRARAKKSGHTSYSAWATDRGQSADALDVGGAFRPGEPGAGGLDLALLEMLDLAGDEGLDQRRPEIDPLLV